MLALRSAVARRATVRIFSFATPPSTSTVPFACQRWKSKKAGPGKKPTEADDSEGKPDKDEARHEDVREFAREARQQLGNKDGDGTVATYDGQRVRAGETILRPHATEPDACTFVIFGSEEWLNTCDGILDADGKKKRLTVPSLWLRDNCQCPKCLNPDTRQRTFNTFELERPRLVKAEWSYRPFASKSSRWKHGVMPEGYRPTDEKVAVIKARWSDGHVGEYSRRWLRRLVRSQKAFVWGVALTWDKQIYENPEEAAVWGDEPILYNRFLKDDYHSGMYRLMDTLDKWGVATIQGVPSASGGHTKDLLEMIGPIRNTHYGGFYDFTADLAKKDSAYTNEALAPHTDTTYFTEPAGLQAFHVLSHKNATNGDPATGGETILVDGIRAAVLLEKADPHSFKILCDTRIPWLSNGNEDASIMPDARYPVIELHPESGEITRIRWNNADRGHVPLEQSVEWYEAARKFNALLSSPWMQLKFKLKPGTLLLTNNWRVLHGRTAFTGERRVCGAYINRDDFQSRWRLTRGMNDYFQAPMSFQDDFPVNVSKLNRMARWHRQRFGAYESEPQERTADQK